MSANNTQVGGTHYHDMTIQPWDAMQAWMTPEEFAGYLLGNVIKYAARHRAKGGIEDLRKARHYLDKLIQTKEVVPIEPQQPRGQPCDMSTVAPPASGEWLAGDLCGLPCGCVATIMDCTVSHKFCAMHWPGPDWTQAPEGCTGWVAQAPHRHRLPKALWIFGPGELHHSGCWNTSAGYRAGQPAPLFGYPGQWTDSLRVRPAPTP